MPAYKFIAIYLQLTYNRLREVDTIMVTDAQKKATKKYQCKLEMISIRVPKGEPDLFKLHANSQGESLAAFMRRAAKETMERDRTKRHE